MLTYNFVQIQVFLANDEGRKGYLSRNDLKVALVELFGFIHGGMDESIHLPWMDGCAKEDMSF